MALKNKDISTLIKMHCILELYTDTIWGENHLTQYQLENKEGEKNTITVTYNDFKEFSKIIATAIEHKRIASNKANEYNKANKEYHNITVNMSYYKSKGNMEKYEYWKQQLEKYKKNKEVK